MPSVTETRLNDYLKAEREILQAQEVRGGDRTHRMTELERVVMQIDKLQLQLSREGRRQGGLNHSLATFQ